MHWFFVVGVLLPCCLPGRGDAQLINIAKNKPTAQSSTYSVLGNRFTSDRAVDGKKNTDLFDGSCSNTDYESRPWLYVDLLKEYVVTGFQITNRGDCCGARINGFQAWVQNDRNPQPRTDIMCMYGNTINDGETKKFNCLRKMKGRYFFIQLPKRSSLSICELEVYAEASKPVTPPLPPGQIAVKPEDFLSFPYDNNEGRCVHVSYYEGLTTWCTNEIYQIFVQKDSKWKLVGGSLSSISAGPSGVWGVSSGQEAFYRQGVSMETPEGLIWSGLDGKFKHISSGPEGVVWGVASDGNIQCREEITCDNPMGMSWKKVPDNSKFIRTSCNANGCYALAEDGNLMFRFGVTRDDCAGTSWKKINYDRVDGKFSSIESSTDGNRAIAVTEKQLLYMWIRNLMSKDFTIGTWSKISKLEYVHATPAQMGYIAVSKKSEIRYIMKKKGCMPSKRQLDQVDAGDAHSICGISNGNIYQKQGKNWIQMDGALTQISCSDHQIWGVNRYRNLYYRLGTNCNNHFGSGWKEVPGQFKYVDVGVFGSVYGINMNDQIYRRIGITNDNPMGTAWSIVPGRLNSISCGPYACWGIDYRQSVQMQHMYPRYQEHSFKILPGLKLKQVETGEHGLVIGISDKNILWLRMGVSKMNPMGTGWATLKESVTMAALHGLQYIVIDTEKQVMDCELPMY